MTLVRNETQRHSAALKNAGQNPISLLPLDGPRGLGSAIQHHPINLGNIPGNPVSNPFQYLVRQSEPVGGHRVLGNHWANNYRMPIGTGIALYPYAAHICQEDYRALPNLAIKAGSGEFFANYQVSGTQNI